MVCLQAHHRRENIFQASQNNQRERIEDAASSHDPSRSPSPQHYPSVPFNSPALQDENSSSLQEDLPNANTFRSARSSDEMTHMDPTNDWMDDLPTSPTSPVQETTHLHVSSSDRITPKEPTAQYPYKDPSADGDSNLPLRPDTPEGVWPSPLDITEGSRQVSMERSVTPPSTKPSTSTNPSKRPREHSLEKK